MFNDSVKLKNLFAVKRPCSNCPFRNDEDAISLEARRREGIIESLLSGEHTTFHCHKTVYRRDDRNHKKNGDYVPVDVSQCPGAAAIARKFGRDSVMVQIATRLGVIPPDYYDEAMGLTIEIEQLCIDRKKARI